MLDLLFWEVSDGRRSLRYPVTLAPHVRKCLLFNFTEYEMIVELIYQIICDWHLSNAFTCFLHCIRGINKGKRSRSKQNILVAFFLPFRLHFPEPCTLAAPKASFAVLFLASTSLSPYEQTGPTSYLTPSILPRG